MVTDTEPEYLVTQCSGRVWSATVNSIHFSVLSAPKTPEAFEARYADFVLGDISLTHLMTDSILYRRDASHIRQDDDDYVLVSFALRSRLRFKQAGLELCCEPGHFLIERSSLPYEFVQEVRGDVWAIKVRAGALKQRVRNLDKFTPYTFDALTGVGGLLLDFIRMMPRRLAETAPDAASGFGRTIVDLLALAMENDERVLGSRQGSVQKGHLARIENYIRRNLGDRSLTPSTIASANGISSRYLHELFREAGTSVGRWILEQRLSACDADLLQGARRETITEVAYRWGFSDAAHFSRLFKHRFGITPTERRPSAYLARPPSY